MARTFFGLLVRGISFTALGLALHGCAAKKIKPGEFTPIPVQEQYRIFETLPRVKVVGFADTFTLTKEIPGTQQEWMSVLYLEREFDVLATLGSGFDVWLAMDLILNQEDEESIRQARLRGMPIGYQTLEMERFFSWVRETRDRGNPFYVVGLGHEVASSYGWRNQFLIRTFAETLKRYGAGESIPVMEAGLNPLLLLKKCGETGFPRNEEEVESVKKSIANLESLVKGVATTVAERFPAHPHASVLQALPSHFSAVLELCRTKALPKARIELEVRSLVQTQAKWSKSGRVLLLGEFDVLRNTPQTLGGALKAKFGKEMYTVATVPVKGEVIARTKPPRKIAIEGNESPVQVLFQGLREPALIPMGSLAQRAKRWVPLFQRSRAFLEGGGSPVEWAKEVDAILAFPSCSPSGKWYLDHLQFKKEW